MVHSMPREWWKRSQSVCAAPGTVGMAKADLIVPLIEKVELKPKQTF